PQRSRPLCSLASSLLRASPTSPSHSSSATASGLPDNVPAPTGGDGDGDLPVPVQKASAHARVYDDAGSACVSRYRHRPYCLLWDENISTPNLSYAAQYLACAFPCERFTSALADNPRITRGRYGSLLLHRDGLPPSTFCRSPGAPVHNRTRHRHRNTPRVIQTPAARATPDSSHVR